MNATPSLTALSRGGAAVPRPPIRWKTRVLLPFAILAAAAGLLGYAARSALWPSIDVWVVPVVAKPVVGGGAAPVGQGAPRSGAPGQGQILVQAPGWVEPSPYAVNVPALTEGVVKEVLVLEGQSVMEGQPVARLIDEDAKLVLLRAEAELVERRAETAKAEAELAAAVARVSEVKDEIDRKRSLVQAGGISEGQFARLELRLASMNKEIDAARAAVNAAGAAVNTHEVLCIEARLALERTEVRAPASGVVLSRLVEPGSRISMAKSGDAMAGTVVRLYDPEFLQVRVEVPLGDVAKIGVGTPAEIVTEALPDTVFRGRIIRVVHEANIQRNTVQVKVSIDQPVPTLKPEMLTRVRFYSVAAVGKAEAGRPAGAPTAEAGVRLLVPIAALIDRKDDKARIWIVDQGRGGGTSAALRDLTLGGAADDSYIEAVQGVNPADRVIVDPSATLTPGARVPRARGKGEAMSIAAPSNNGVLIECRDLTKVYHKGDVTITPLQELDLDVRAGDFLALMGPSGSGKTTLLNLIAGIDTPTGGTLRIAGTDIAALSRSRLADWRSENVGYIFQLYNLVPVLTAYENVELPLLLRRMSRRERHERVSTALELVGIADRHDHYPRQLSGGQEQRVAIARAIVTDPRIIVADEPTGDLDAHSAAAIMDLLGRLNRELGKTLIMVTHDAKCAAHARATLHLEKGRLVEAGALAHGLQPQEVHT